MWNLTMTTKDRHVYHGKWFCKSEHLATQHDFSWCHQSSHNLPLYSTFYWTVTVTNLARRGEKDHHQQTAAPRTDINQHCSGVANEQHGQRHTNLQSDVIKSNPLDQDLGSQSQTALQQHYRTPHFYGTYGLAVSRKSHSGQSIQI
jgi:hypothetical protein